MARVYNNVMWKRLLVGLTLAFLPITVSAEDALMPALAGLQQQPAATTSGPGSSNAAAGSLQPAGNAPLQSSGTASNGLVAPTANQLQAPTSNNEQLRIWLNGETEGGPQTSGSPWESSYTWIGLVLGLFGLAAGLLWLRGQTRRPHQSEDTSDKPSA